MDLRIELLVRKADGEGTFPEFLGLAGIGHEIRKCSGGYYLSVVGQNTPLLRAQLVELITANPGTVISVCRSWRDDRAQRPVRALVDFAFSESDGQPLSYNMKEAARRLGISYSHMKQLVEVGRIRRINGRISGRELERYLNKCL